MKIKDLINKLLNKLKIIWKTYPVTMIFVSLITLFLIIFSENMDKYNELFSIFSFLILFSFGSLFAEIFFDKKKRYLYYLLFAILSIIFVFLTNASGNVINEIGNRLIISYCLIIIISCFYKLYKNSKLELSSYMISSISNALKTSIIYSILAIGLLIITEIFNYLIVDNDHLDIILRIEAILFGLFYIPNLLNDFTNVKKDNYHFMKVLIHYTLLPLIILSFIIVYIYIFKIIITLEIPSNEIFKILALLFIFYLPIWIMNDYYNDDIIFKINNKLPIFFIPFIILQIYSLCIRILNNGFTNIRYIGLILIIFEIAHIIIYFLNKKIDYLFLALISLIVITFLMPFINMYNISCYSQSQIIDKLLLKDDYSKEEKIKLYSAYRYLEKEDYSNRYLKKYSDEVKDKIELYKDARKNNYNYLSASIKTDLIDINNYSSLYNIDYSDNYIDEDKIMLRNNYFNIDITNIIMEYIENSYDFNNYFKGHNEFVIDDMKVIFTYVSIEYENRQVTSLSIDGFVLK